jgi:hypothetical protein
VLIRGRWDAMTITAKSEMPIFAKELETETPKAFSRSQLRKFKTFHVGQDASRTSIDLV